MKWCFYEIKNTSFVGAKPRSCRLIFGNAVNDTGLISQGYIPRRLRRTNQGLKVLIPRLLAAG